MKSYQRILLVSTVGCCCGYLKADAVFDAPSNTIHITDFPADAPCTPAALARIDQIQGWGGKAVYNPAEKTGSIHANLQIGAVGGRDSYFVVEDITLTVNGDITVSPSKRIADSAPSGINCLKIGSAGADAPNTLLKLGTGKTITVGAAPAGQNGHFSGGAWEVYRATVTGENGRWGGKVIKFGLATQCKFVNARIDQFGDLFYGLDQRSTIIDNTVFSNGGSVTVGAFNNPGAAVANCRFENLAPAALMDYGWADGVLKNCVFSGNQRNFSLRFSKGLELIDCDIAPGKHPDIIRARKSGAQMVYPRLTVRYTVKVTPANAKIRCDQTGENLIADGDGNVLLTAYTVTATDGEVPSRAEFSYSMEADGRRIDAFKPAFTKRNIEL